MAKRKEVPDPIQTKVLVKSGRRCCVCFGINNDYNSEKQGQIAHLDHRKNNNKESNLAFLCLEHHDKYDSTTRLSKNLKMGEVKEYRKLLYKKIEKNRATEEKVIKLIGDTPSTANEVAHVKQETTIENITPQPIKGSSPRKPGKDEKKAMQLSSMPYSEAAMVELRSLLYTTPDYLAQIVCIGGITNFFDFRKDSVSEMLTLCDQGILLTQKHGLKDAEATLLANKAHLVSQHFLLRDLDGYYRTQMAIRTGLPTITEEERKGIIQDLKNLQETYKSLFKEAIKKAYESNLREVIAAVLIRIGSAAGMRATHFRELKMKDREDAEKSLAKLALLESKNLYFEAGNESHAAYALHQLANQLRFLGETTEAKKICKQVIKIAQKYKDKSLEAQAKNMLQSIISGHIPDYMNGEDDKPRQS